MIGAKHGILFSKEITCVAVDHPETSMNTVDPERIIYCRDKIIQLLEKETLFIQKYKKSLKYIHSNLSSLALLMYSERGEILIPLRSLMVLILCNPKELLRKRTYVILRNMFFNMLPKKTIP